MNPKDCKTTLDILEYLFEILPQTQITFATYFSRPHLEERAPRWRDGENVDELFRTVPDNEIFRLLTDQYNRREMIDRIEQLRIGEALKFLSPVYLHGDLYHLPLLDLNSSLGDKQEPFEVTKKIFKADMFRQQYGFLLSTGNGFHFIGTNPIPKKKFFSFCGAALLAGDFVDTRYIGYHLSQPQPNLSLRIARKDPDCIAIPQVVAYW